VTAARRQGGSLIAVSVACALAFTASLVLLHHSLWGHVDYQLRDTPLYEAYADATRAGDLPYRDFRIEYPPGALAAILAPETTATAGNYFSYNTAFERWMGACGIAMACLTVFALGRLGAGRRRTVAAAALVAVSPLLLGAVYLARFDLLPAMLTAAAVALVLAGRERAGIVALALGGVTKLYPFVCLPVLLIWIAKRKGGREAAVCGAIALAIAAAVLLPFAALAPDGFMRSFSFQLGRPLQVESLAASLLAAAHGIAGLHLALRTDHGSDNIVGAAGGAAKTAATVVQVALLALVYVLFARGPATKERLVLGVAASVAVFVAFGKVFSPQYLIWLVPLVPLVAGRRGLAASLLLAAALVLTQLWFPRRYDLYAHSLPLAETGLVVLRDLAVAAIAALLVLGLASRSPRTATAEAG
jgi:uncharacterized membrane protein